MSKFQASGEGEASPSLFPSRKNATTKSFVSTSVKPIVVFRMENTFWVRITNQTISFYILYNTGLKLVRYPGLTLEFSFIFFFLVWDSFNARLNNHYKVWSYKKKKHKKIKAYRKSV